jgi:hypothetical protein
MPSTLSNSMHQVWVVSSTVLFGIYRSVYLDRVAEVPIGILSRAASSPATVEC